MVASITASFDAKWYSTAALEMPARSAIPASDVRPGLRSETSSIVHSMIWRRRASSTNVRERSGIGTDMFSPLTDR
jgi:hypothetical protein